MTTLFMVLSILLLCISYRLLILAAIRATSNKPESEEPDARFDVAEFLSRIISDYGYLVAAAVFTAFSSVVFFMLAVLG